MEEDEAVAVAVAGTNITTITGVGRTAVVAHRVKTTTTTTTKQNPLVQIGYRIRTRTLQEMVDRFFLKDDDDDDDDDNDDNDRFYSSSSSPSPPSSSSSTTSSSINIQKKNLLVIGAGLDVTIGLRTVQSRRDVAVVELDLPDVCHAKRQRLLLLEEETTSSVSSSSAGAMDWIPSSGEDGGRSGWVVCCRGTCRSTGSSYTLIATDLNHIMDDEPLWQNQLLALLTMRRPEPRQEEEAEKEEDTNNHNNNNKSNNNNEMMKKKNATVCFETLVISELVLTYLSPLSCDALLRFLAHQQRHPKKHQFHLVAYEPLGNDYDDDDSIVASYRAEYRQRFCEKLSSSTSSSSQNNNNNNNNGSDTTTITTTTTTMTPLGGSLRHVRDRMRQLAGFSFSYARYPTAISADFLAVRSMNTNTNNNDHLCGRWLFDEHAALALHLRSYVVSVSSNDLLTRYRLSLLLPNDDPRPREVSSSSSSTKVWLCRCGGSNENYHHDDDIDEAIRSVFRQSYEAYFAHHPAIRRLCDQVVGCNGSFRSSIGGWYHRRGGAFWMLVAKTDNDDDSAPTTAVVGGLGLRRLDYAEATKRKLPTSTDTACVFEMERVFVAPAFRGRGLSKELLDAALEFAGRSTIVAVTLSVLTEANGLYAKRGFALTATETKGSLTYCTYTRTNVPENES